ncbi:hypothetical protein Lal_00013486 [Lupinus albus]|nr:hypothetical protein Lal_00013486 [Lupinus albus]
MERKGIYCASRVLDVAFGGQEGEPAQQVFYVSDPANKKWSIVLLTNKIIINNIDDQEDIDAEDDPFLGYYCRMRADQ